MSILPQEMIDRFREKLIKATETLSLSRFSQQEILVPPEGRYKHRPTGDTSIARPEIQASPNGRSAPSSSPAPATVLESTEITAKTTQEISAKSGQPTPDSTNKKTELLNLFNGPRQEKELNKENALQAEVQVLPDTQQETKDQELKSQGQQNIFMEKKFLCGAGYSFEKENTSVEHQVASLREGSRNIPKWVQDYEHKVRLGNMLPRSELVKLAEYRLGAEAEKSGK